VHLRRAKRSRAARACGGQGAIPFIVCRVEPGVVRTPRSGGGHSHGSACLARVADGPCGPRGWAGMDSVGPSGLAQVGKDRFCFLPKLFSSAKQIQENPRKC
jgi:hypothetical protein